MDLHIIAYCAEECARQRSGENSVYDMCNAWDYASYIAQECVDCPPIALSFIEYLGKLVEPKKNKNGFRRQRIFISDGFYGYPNHEIGANWERIPDTLSKLIESYYGGILYHSYQGEDTFGCTICGVSANKHNMKAQSAEDIFYYEYEQIHPFVDGNGRTGKILYNYLKGTLDIPVMPPNFWGSSNP